MKRLMTFCFVILFAILAAFSCYDFTFDAINRIEENKTIITIEKPDGMENKVFLKSLAQAMNENNVDIMIRNIDVTGNKPVYHYYRTNNTDDFFSLYRNIPELSQIVLIDDFVNADSLNLDNAKYYIRTVDEGIILSNLEQLGLTASRYNGVLISNQSTSWLFLVVPSFMFIASIAFYALSSGKKNVLMKMEGFSTKDILVSEGKRIIKELGLCSIGMYLITTLIAGFLFKKALFSYMMHLVSYLVLILLTVVIGTILSCFIILNQKSAEYIKGRVPRKGIYATTVVAKTVFVTFLMFFLSIAIGNVSISRNTISTLKHFEDKLDGYVTISVSDINTSIDASVDGYKDFYLETVNEYKGVLIAAGNYQYDLLDGKTLAEKYGQIDITINRNYLEFNPIYDLNGNTIAKSSLKEDVTNVLLPSSKDNDENHWREYIRSLYDTDVNFIMYDDLQSEIYSYNANSGVSNYGKISSPVVIVANDKNLHGVFLQSYCSQGAYFIKTGLNSNESYQELLPILKRAGIERMTSETPSVKDTFNEMLGQQRMMLILYGSQSIASIVGLLCMIIFSTKIYCENYKAKIASSLIEGYPILTCMKKHLVITMLYFALAFAGATTLGAVMQVNFNNGILAMTFVCEMVLMFVASTSYSKKNLYQIVKGAE